MEFCSPRIPCCTSSASCTASTAVTAGALLADLAPAIAAACHSFDGTWRTKLPMRDTAAAKAMGVRMPKPPKKR